MFSQHIQNQEPPFLRNSHSITRGFQAGSLLGNNNAQKPPSERFEPASPLQSKVSPVSKIEALKKKRFSPEGKAERVARSLAALNQVAIIHLTPEEWRQIAEDPDVEDQF